jgi:hypothetical protein
MAPQSRWFRWPVLWAVCIGAAMTLPQIQAQTLEDGWTPLNNKSLQARGRLTNLFKGSEKFAGDKSQIELVDLLAKRYAYGILLNPDMTNPVQLRREMNEFDSYISSLQKDREMLQPLSDVFRDKVRLRAKEMLDLDNRTAHPIHKIHAARLLAKVAVLGQGQLAETLLAVLKDAKQNDGVRYYLLRGLSTLLAQVQPGTTKPVLTNDEQKKSAEALVEFLEQRKGPSPKAPPDEIDGFRMLRREAIRALAQIHTPTISDKIRPALVLARFAGNDERIQPPPRIDERIEAAMGLARMQTAKDKLYQSDYAAGQIAKCLGAFGQMAKGERADYEKNERMMTRPWRIDATMLKEALAVLKTEGGKNEYVARMVERSDQLLGYVINGKTLDANDLTWFNSPESDPPSKELFQGATDSVVKPAQPGDDAPPEK